MNIKNNRGVTLTVLIITIIVLIILAGITINAGTESIKKAQLETLKTNMLLIRAKAKEYCEEANFKAGTNNEIEKGTEYLENEAELNKVNSIPGSSESFDFIAKLDKDDLKRIGLNEVANSKEAGDFYIGFKISDNQVEIYNSQGFKSNDGKTYYKLSELENIDE